MRNLFRRSKPVRSISPDSIQTKPQELYGKSTSRPGTGAFVYISDGASGEDYSDLFTKAGISGEVYSHLGGKADLCAIHYFPQEGPFPELINGFRHEEASFAGFTVRRRDERYWEWFCEDKAWHPITEDMPRKQVLQEGEQPDFPAGDSGIYIFEPVWIDRSGRQIHCGYAMFSNRLMAHAFGGMNNKLYHNTIAAYKNGIRHGYRFFEIDLSMTVDERLVLCHGWKESNCVHTGIPYSPDLEQTMTYEKLMAMKVHGNPLIDARDFYDHIKKHPDHHFEIDFHRHSGEEAKKRIRLMLEDFRYDEEVLDRLLIQAYSQDMFRAMDEIWHFKHTMYLVGRKIDDLDNLITYMLDEGICAMTARGYLMKPDCVTKLKNAGIYILAHTISKDYAAANKLLESGVDSICTDYVTEKALRSHSETMAKYPYYIWYNTNLEEAKQIQISHGYEEAHVSETKTGNLEFRDPKVWINDGTRALAKCAFDVPGKRFAGWNLRMKVDGTWLWYCRDGYYRPASEFYRTPEAVPAVFADQQVMPVLTVRNNAKLVMSAVWE